MVCQPGRLPPCLRKRLEGWLVLGIFLAVAIIIVGCIQTGLSRARSSEREALFMYELSTALSGLCTQDAVIQILAKHLQQLFQAELVEVFVNKRGSSPAKLVKTPADRSESSEPDRILPILAAPELVGEIQIWRGNGWLPSEESRLLKNFTTQASMALERAQLTELENSNRSTISKMMN